MRVHLNATKMDLYLQALTQYQLGMSPLFRPISVIEGVLLYEGLFFEWNSVRISLVDCPSIPQSQQVWSKDWWSTYVKLEQIHYQVPHEICCVGDASSNVSSQAYGNVRTHFIPQIVQCSLGYVISFFNDHGPTVFECKPPKTVSAVLTLRPTQMRYSHQ